MSKIVGYMVTWTTYGTWLQGHHKGYVSDGKVLPRNDKLLQICKDLQKQPTVKLNNLQKDIAFFKS